MIDLGATPEMLYNAWMLEATFASPRGGADFVSHGSGFIIGHEKLTHAALITNRHVVDASFANPKRVGYRLVSVHVSGYAVHADGLTTRQAFEISGNIFVNTPEGGLDAALLGLGKFNILEGPKNIERWFHRGHLATQEEFESNVFAGDFVLIPGFPKLGDEQVVRPVFLPGIIASDPRHPYLCDSADRTFLVQALSHSGLSGAPIWAVQRGIPGLHGPHAPRQRLGRLVGINTGHYKGDTDGPAAFSIAVRSDVVLDLIAHWDE